MIEQTTFKPEFVDNPEKRVACVLLLDTSTSMQGTPIAELNVGLATYKDALLADPLAVKRVEVAIVTFGGQVQTICDFTTAASFQPPTLVANGDTPIGAAIREGLDLVRARKEVYKANGVSYLRPWVFLITDGAPTDEWQSAAELVRQGKAAKAFSFWAVGVEGAQFEVLKQIAVKAPLKLQGLRFRELFRWLSSSQSAVSSANPGQPVQLSDPTVGPRPLFTVEA
jgi:uncharacterized protein YegL